MNSVRSKAFPILLAASLAAGSASLLPAVAQRVPVVDPNAVRAHIYPAVDQAQADIKAGLEQAKREHKHVLLDFGGDWCGDCQVLNYYFHQPQNAELLDKNYVRVNINIGHEDANLDIAHRYGVPVHGVPALAVLNSQGKVLVSQDKEFADMRYMQTSSVTQFLNRWK